MRGSRCRHVSIELLDLRLEQNLQLVPFGLQSGSQQAVLDGELLLVDVDVLHLQEETVRRLTGCLTGASKTSEQTDLLKGLESCFFTEPGHVRQDGLLHLLPREQQRVSMEMLTSWLVG